jgi:hypothetical protein
MIRMQNPIMSAPSAKRRDERLDFFRGLAMFIIFIAHMPGNSWFGFIPARFGFSSAGEVFVFCSGLASSLAFGRVFITSGGWTGTKRVLFRLWQVYWAHLSITLVLLFTSLAGAKLLGIDYPGMVGFGWLLAHPDEGFFALMLLGLSPNFLDILPMYLVLLAMIPPVMMIGKHAPKFVMAGLLGLWLMVQITGFNLPGGAKPELEWYFNPFAWQLIFFTGFAFGLGWLPRPSLKRGKLFWLCATFLLASIPVNFWGILDQAPALMAFREFLLPETSKTNLHALLFLHFLCCAYVALVLIDPYRALLPRFWPIILVGQQALATFLAGVILALIGGMVMDIFGRGALITALVNLIGFAALIGVAALARAYKGGAKPKTGQEPQNQQRQVSERAILAPIARPQAAE